MTVVDADEPSAPVVRALIKTLILVVALAVAVIGLTIAVIGLSRANSTKESVQSQCLFYYGVGLTSGPTIPPTTTAVGLSILVGARVAYEGLGCQLGDLPKPAPQVAAQLPTGVH